MGIVILFSLIIVLVPLIVYGLSPEKFFFSILTGRVYALFLFEFMWYSILLLIMLRLASAFIVFVEVLACMVYRLCLGVAFGLLIMVGGGVGLQMALDKGIWAYTPVVLIHIISTPFVLKGFFNQMVLWDMRKKKILRQISEQDIPVAKPPESRDAAVEPLSEAREMDWTSPLRYVKEYSGVEGVFLVDNEGLIVARATGKQIDDERLAPFMLGLEEANNQALRKLNEKKLNRVELYTSSRWINLTRIFNLILVTVANRYTDDLLNVRIIQAAEMIRKYMRKRYTQEVLTEAEDKNV
ncbi:MAG TPA: roadblock/LC7 domain-containing protein [candidate division Zixibacteria bacterium]